MYHIQQRSSITKQHLKQISEYYYYSSQVTTFVYFSQSLLSYFKFLMIISKQTNTWSIMRQYHIIFTNNNRIGNYAQATGVFREFNCDKNRFQFALLKVIHITSHRILFSSTRLGLARALHTSLHNQKGGTN